MRSLRTCIGTWLLLASPCFAITITTIDFTPVAGDWDSFVASGAPVKVTVGGYGTATLTYSMGGLNPIVDFAGTQVHNPGLTYSLSNGDTLVYSHELVVSFGQIDAAGGADATMALTIALDDPSKTFPLGTQLVVYSLDREFDGSRNGFNSGAQLGAPDSVATYTDGDPSNELTLQGSYYAAVLAGTSVGHPFPLLSPANSLSIGLVSNDGAQGIGFALAVPSADLPEPSSLALVFLGGVASILSRLNKTGERPKPLPR